MGDNTDDNFQQGVDAYGAGISREDCPHPKDSDEREIWLDGWDEAQSLADDDETRDNA